MEVQYFNGEKFALYDGNNYFQSTATGERMHRKVWKYYYGEIPKGCHVHHKDENKSNNDISNLELLQAGDHVSLHSKERFKDPETLERQKQRLTQLREMTKVWHASEEGHEWHKAHYERMKDKLNERSPKRCAFCGKEFLGTCCEKFCSNKCKSAWRRKAGLDNEARQCIVCGKTFIINHYGTASTCSRECAGFLISLAKLGKSRKNRT